MSFMNRISAAVVAIALGCAPLVTAVVALTPTSVSAQAPAADTPPASAVAAPVVKKEMIDNPYGIGAMLKHGDWVSIAERISNRSTSNRKDCKILG